MYRINFLRVYLELFRVNGWEKIIQPLAVGRGIHDTSHQRRLCETGRGEVAEDRLGACGTMFVATEEPQRGVVDCALRSTVVHQSCVVEDKSHGESGVRMQTNTHWVIQ